MAIERELLVEPSDFRLWVCLHEETHRVQFAAVPWLREYLTDQVAQVVDSADLDPAVLAQMLRNAVQRMVEGLSSNGRSRSSTWSRRPRSGRSWTGSPR